MLNPSCDASQWCNIRKLKKNSLITHVIPIWSHNFVPYILLAPSRVFSFLFSFPQFCGFESLSSLWENCQRKKTLAPSPTCFFTFMGGSNGNAILSSESANFLKLLSWECIKFWNLFFFFFAMGQSMRSITKRKFWTLHAHPLSPP